MFTAVHFRGEHVTTQGLAERTISRLDRLVMLAGPNGAGKSRYLRSIDWMNRNLDALRRPSDFADRDMEELRLFVNAEPRDDVFGLKQILARAIFIQDSFPPTSGAKPMSERQVVYLRYENVGSSIPNPNDRSQKKNDEIVNENQSGGFNTAFHSLHAYFAWVARALYDIEHPRSKESVPVQERAADAESFNKVLTALLGAGITPQSDEQSYPQPFFRGRLFKPDELSDGERVLATWAVMLHRQRAWLSDAIVLIDEPENHLHPDACVKALDALLNEILGPHGQVFVATHSVPLLAYAGLERIFFVENNSVEYAGNKTDVVMDRLLGGKDGRERLVTFLSDASEVGFDNFAAQCLLDPGVAAPQVNDPQQKQMAALVESHPASSEPVRILDFAAGKGRLAAALAEKRTSSTRPFLYSAFNDQKFDSDEQKKSCLEHIARLGQEGSPEYYYFNSLEKLIGTGRPQMDIVVMCNVLHEIPVRHWVRHLHKIAELLSGDGYLAIFEDQLPPVGELPHAGGYMILDQMALEVLFGGYDAVEVLNDGPRLTGFKIRREFLKRATKFTIEKTLKKVSEVAKEQIELLRDPERSPASFQNGRKHAHYVMQFANAQLALQEYA